MNYVLKRKQYVSLKEIGFKFRSIAIIQKYHIELFLEKLSMQPIAI